MDSTGDLKDVNVGKLWEMVEARKTSAPLHGVRELDTT